MTNNDAWMRVIPVSVPYFRITGFLRILLGVLFATALAIWTWKLLEPNPVPESFVGELRSFSDALPFMAAKCLHMSGYAFLAVLSGLLFEGRRWKLTAFFVLFLHGIGTEIGQTFIPNRNGCVRDVIIDTCGVLSGAFLTRRYWREDRVSQTSERYKNW